MVSNFGCKEERHLLTHKDATFGKRLDLLLRKERENDGFTLPVYSFIVEENIKATELVFFLGYLVVFLRLRDAFLNQVNVKNLACVMITEVKSD